MGEWERRRVLIGVRTYPVPAHNGIEVSCTAAITETGDWMRLFPIPYRFLEADKRFTKYQWINAKVRKARNDSRPESFNIDVDSIQIESFVPPTDNWSARKDLVLPLKRQSLCEIYRERDTNGYPTLGIFKPRTISRLTITEVDAEWNRKERDILNQQLFPFLNNPSEKLEKVPFKFSYEFTCDDSGCHGHDLSCTDWEMGEAYRRWKDQYGTTWEEKFRQKFEAEMITRFDTHFFVGTLHQHPNNWIIVGLFYPLNTPQLGLFHS